MSAAPDSPAVELAASLGFESFPVSPDPIRIYVACLAAYNNGHLHGVGARRTPHMGDDTRHAEKLPHCKCRGMGDT